MRLELEMGQRLFNERHKRSEVSGIFLGEDYDHCFCSHVLSKGAYPRLRLYPKNIILMGRTEHNQWEFEQHKIKDDPKWQWVFQLQQLLIQEYYHKPRIFFEQLVVKNTR